MTIAPLEMTVNQTFQATQMAVFEAILSAPAVAPAVSKPGDVIEVITLDGTPFQAGHRATVRINYGKMDLQFVDTLQRYDPPYQVKLERLPQGAFHYDHTERLPPDVWDDFKPDPAHTFRKMYGDTPHPQDYAFTVTPDGNHAVLSVRMVIQPIRRMTGWGQRRAIKRMKNELMQACDQIGQRL